MTDLFEVLDAAPAKPIDTEWTEGRINLLIQLRDEGLRRHLIAQKLNEMTGATFTKSSVCGKIFRLFPPLKPRKTEEEKLAIKLAARRRDAQAKRDRRQKMREGVDPDRKSAARGRIDPGPYKCREVDAPFLHIQLQDLESHHCRYPYGDNPRETTYCGQKIADNHLSFCAVHLMLCTRPWVDKVAA
jgi:hypothetical protein